MTICLTRAPDGKKQTPKLPSAWSKSHAKPSLTPKLTYTPSGPISPVYPKTLPQVTRNSGCRSPIYRKKQRLERVRRTSGKDPDDDHVRNPADTASACIFTLTS